ncbi:hypothetical protein ACC764_39590, partial [Rhizobium ruizarguesonis]
LQHAGSKGLDKVAAMFAAEWMYWTWSKAEASCPISDPLLKEWVDNCGHRRQADPVRRVAIFQIRSLRFRSLFLRNV